MFNKFRQNIFKKANKEQGFTLLEVLVSMLIATIFVAMTMQAMVLATMLRVKAQEKQYASQMIKQDLEIFKALASDTSTSGVEIDTSKCNPQAQANGYAQKLLDKFNAAGVATTKNMPDATNYSLQLSRTYTQEAPYKTLKIQYKITTNTRKNGSNAREITTDYAEVIPSAALQCP